MMDGEFKSAEERDTHALALNGISRVPASHYLVDGYRYTTLADAMAQARRGLARSARPRHAGLFGQAQTSHESSASPDPALHRRDREGMVVAVIICLAVTMVAAIAFLGV